MNWQLHAIEQPCTRIPGSLKAITLIDPHDLSDEPMWAVMQNIEALVFEPGKAGYLLEQDHLTASLTGDTDTGNESGDFCTYTLNATYRNVRGDIEFLRAKFFNRKIHVLATYRDGTMRLLPYMRLRMRDDSGLRIIDKQGYAFTATCRLSTPAPLLEAEINVAYPDGTTYTPPSSEGAGVTKIADTTTETTYTYELPAGVWLVGVYVRSDEAQTVSLGSSPATDDLGGTLSADANDQILFQCNNFRPLAPANIYLAGLAGTNSIEIWYLA